MTEATANGWELLEELEYLPWGAAHRELANRIIGLAQETGDEALEFDARQQLVDNGAMKGATDLALANFAWCVAKYDERPAWFDQDPDRVHQFFWQHKWMTGLLANSPAFSRDQIRDLIDEMEARFTEAGLGMSAVFTARFELAVDLGELDEAEHWAQVLRSTPRDDFSSCAACVPADFVALALSRRDEAKAVELAVETWREGETCATQPGSMLAHVLVPMLRLGREAEAVEAFEQVRNDLGEDRDRVEDLALCAEFASVTGNHDLALALVERHLGWLAQDALHEAANFHAAASFAVVLERAARAHHGVAIMVRASADPALAPLLGEVDGPMTAAELARVLWEVAEDLAVQFDARNGTTSFGGSLADSRSLVDFDVPVPIEEATLFAPLSIAAPAPATAFEWWVRAIAARYAQDDRTAGDCAGQALALADNSRDGLELRWSAHQLRHSVAAAAGDEEGAARAAAEWTAFAREVFGAAGERLAAAEVEPGNGEALADVSGELASAPAGLRAMALVSAASAHGNAAGELSPKGAAWIRARLDEAEELLGADGVPGSDVGRVRAAVARAGARMLRARVALSFDDDPEQALLHVGRVDGSSVPGLSDAIAAMAAAARGRIAYRMDELASAAKGHEQSASAFARAGFLGAAHREAANAAQLRLWNGEGAEALTRIEYALSLLPADEPTPSALLWLHAQSLLAIGEADRAVPLLERILAEQNAEGASGQARAQTHLALARAYEQNSDDRAGEQFGSAAQLFGQAGMHQEAASASVDQATASRYTVGYEAAYAALDRAQAWAARAGDPRLDLLILVTRAEIRIVEPADGWREDAHRAIALARSLDDPARESEVLGLLSDACEFADDSNGEIEFRAQQVDVARSMGDADVVADVATDLAFALSLADRPEDAYAVVRQLWDEREALSAEALELLVECSESILESAGRAHEWEAWQAQLS